VRSVADDIRRRTATRVLEMPTAARIELALDGLNRESS